MRTAATAFELCKERVNFSSPGCLKWLERGQDFIKHKTLQLSRESKEMTSQNLEQCSSETRTLSRNRTEVRSADRKTLFTQAIKAKDPKPHRGPKKIYP